MTGNKLLLVALLLAAYHVWCDDLPSKRGARADAVGNAYPCQQSTGSTTEVTTVEVTLNGIPATLRVPKSQTKAPIILWHGLGSPKSPVELMQALPLDDVPAVKIYLNLPLTGARAPVDPADSLANQQAKTSPLCYWNLSC